MQYREMPLNVERVQTTERMLAVLDPRRLLNGIYVGRLLVASANFAWAVLFALFANPLNTVIAATAFVAAMALTAVSYIHTEVNRRHAGPGFLYAQFVHDLLLITVVVHLTGGGDSQFAALYILVNATAALLLPIGSSLLLALLGSVLYVGDAFLVSGGDITHMLMSGRTRRPSSWQCRSMRLPTSRSSVSGFLLTRSATHSTQAISPSPRTSPTSGRSSSAFRLAWK